MSDIVKFTPRDLFHLTEGQRIEMVQQARSLLLWYRSLWALSV